jgi:hypothetical protein
MKHGLEEKALMRADKFAQETGVQVLDALQMQLG